MSTSIAPNTAAPTTPSSVWSISDWSIGRKVAMVLVLPVLLAAVFGSLRVQTALDQATQYSGAQVQAESLPQIVGFVRAAEQQAIAVASDPKAVDATEYEAVVRQARDQLTLSDLPADQRGALSDALVAGEDILDIARRGGSTSDSLVGNLRQIETSINDYLASIDAETEAPEPALTELGTVISLRNAAADQVIRLSVIENRQDQTARADALAALGRERAALDALTSLSPSERNNLDAAADSRFEALASGQVLSGVRSSALNSYGGYVATADRLAVQVNDDLDANTLAARSAALRDAALVIGALLAALALALLVARQLIQPLRTVRQSALIVARRELPEAIERIRAGGEVPRAMTIPVHTREETGQLARAVEEMHGQALHLAGEQARLRGQVNDMFETLSRRSSSLVSQQLAIIDDLERDEQDPARLSRLFRLDHLAARMRRNGQSLLVLAGATQRVGGSADLPMGDVLRAAMSEVQGYERLVLDVSQSRAAVVGGAVADLSHLFAELMDNALAYSPPDTDVTVQVSRASDAGFLVELRDSGLGMSEDAMDIANRDLQSGGEVTLGTARRMGLFVVGRLAQRHGVTVSLRANGGGSSGITASVHLPGTLVSSPAVDGSPRSHGPAPTESEPAVQRPALAAVPALLGVAAAPAESAAGSVSQPERDAEPEPEVATAAPVGGALPRRQPGASHAGRDPLGDSPAEPTTLPAAERPLGALARFALRQESPHGASDLPQRVPAALREQPDEHPAQHVDDHSDDGEVATSPNEEVATEPVTSDADDHADAVDREPSAESDDVDQFDDVDEFDELDESSVQAPAAFQQFRPRSDLSGHGELDGHQLNGHAHLNGHELDGHELDGPAELNGHELDGHELDQHEVEPVEHLEPVHADDEAPHAAAAPVVDPEDQGSRESIGAFVAARQRAATTLSPRQSTPIFEDLRSKWLHTGDGDGEWASPEIDHGWIAAEAATRAAPVERTEAGLPSRRPGRLLVPGSAPAESPAGADHTDHLDHPDPGHVQVALTSHLNGVRRGREAARRQSTDEAGLTVTTAERDFA